MEASAFSVLIPTRLGALHSCVAFDVASVRHVQRFGENHENQKPTEDAHSEHPRC
jgi:hypothetical protein